MIASLDSVIKPRDYQIPAIEAIENALEIKSEALLVMAMGLGKTITSAFVAKPRLLRGEKGLYLCHENYILEHVEQDYKLVVGDSMVYKTFYGSKGNGKKDWTADDANMLFASFQSLNNWHEQWFQAFEQNHFDFIVIDESHHAPAPTYREVVDYFQAKKLFMTATPDRMDLKSLREMAGEEVYSISLETGIARGWLANVEYHILSDGINNAKLKKICKDLIEKGKRVSIKQLNETIFIHERDKSESQIIEEHAKIIEYSGDRKGLLFCERTTHADKLAPHFERSGVMHSKRSWKHNDDVFRNFEKDDLQYVASVNKFNEGKHVPGVELIGMLRGTNSLTIFWQQLGRALALTETKHGPKKKVIVLDFVANVERLIMVRDMMLRIKKIQGEPVSGPVKPPIDTKVFDVTGEGFEFIFSDELVEVMKIIEALRKGYYETWQEASIAAIGFGIRDYPEYRRKHKQDLRLPPDPHSIYPDFPGYDEFLKGSAAPRDYYPTWQEASIAAVALGARTPSGYRRLYYKDMRLYWSPESMYVGFPGWSVFLSVEEKAEPQSLTVEKVIGILKGKNITDYWSLKYDFGKEKLEKIDFFGLKIYIIYSTIVGRNAPSMSHKDLDDFAKKLGWYPTEEEKIIRYKKEFKKQGITDYNTLVAFPSYKLKTTKFGCFRRAKNFFRIILGFVTEVSPDSREKVAKALGWTLSERKKKKRYKEELLKHGIKNYGDLFERNSADLKALKYGDFGSGIQFFSLVLNDSTSKFTREKIERVAEYLGWSCLPYCRKKLAEKRIVDYLSLMNYGKRKFASTDFEEMGTGAMLANKILGLNRESFKRIDDIELEEIADKLGWKLSEDKKKKLMLSLLAEHNLMNYWDLRKISPVEFRNSTFGPIGKGHKFLGFVLGKTVKRITTNVLDELATKLDLMPVLGEKLIRYATELSKNGVTIYEDLVKIQIADFKKMEFGQFGKGAAFIAEVLDIEKGKVTKASMYEVAKKLNLKGVEDQVLYLRNNKTFAKKKGK